MKAGINKSTSLEPSEVEHLGKGREVSVTITINVEEGKIMTKGRTNNDRSERRKKEAVQKVKKKKMMKKGKKTPKHR